MNSDNYGDAVSDCDDETDEDSSLSSYICNSYEFYAAVGAISLSFITAPFVLLLRLYISWEIKVTSCLYGLHWYNKIIKWSILNFQCTKLMWQKEKKENKKIDLVGGNSVFYHKETTLVVESVLCCK